jgi:hypothetical protein
MQVPPFAMSVYVPTPHVPQADAAVMPRPVEYVPVAQEMHAPTLVRPSPVA